MINASFHWASRGAITTLLRVLVSRLVLSVAILTLAFLVFAIPARAQTGEGYALGPQDQIKIRVFEWRRALGETFEWVAINGDYTVDPSGSVSLPLIGGLRANGLKPAELGASIAQKLQERVGLKERPEASVEITKYRPFYVAGYVDRPGEYPYRPGLTVLQAVTIAGGMRRPPDAGLVRVTRESILSTGEISVLTSERTALLARRARLLAEIEGRDAMTGLEALEQAADASARQAISEEKALFSARRDSITRQKSALERLIGLLNQELANTNAKIDTETRQMQLIESARENVSGLVGRGLARAPQLLELERALAQSEGRLLDFRSLILRAQQDINRAERDIALLIDTVKTDAAKELRDVQAKLEAAAQKIATSEKLRLESESLAPQLASSRERAALLEPSYAILRQDGRMTERVSDSTPVAPGDIVKVAPPPESTLIGSMGLN